MNFEKTRITWRLINKNIKLNKFKQIDFDEIITHFMVTTVNRDI